MVVVVRADPDDFELLADLRSLLIRMIVIPGQTGVASIGIGDVHPVKGASETMITVFGIDRFGPFMRQELPAQFSLFLNSARTEMDIGIQSLVAAFRKPLPDTLRKIGL